MFRRAPETTPAPPEDRPGFLRRLRSRAKQFEESFWSGGSLEDLFDRIGERPPDPMASVFVAAMREWRRSAAKGLLASTEFKAGLKAQVTLRFWPTWPETGTHSIVVSLLGFTRAWDEMQASCR